MNDRHRRRVVVGAAAATGASRAPSSWWARVRARPGWRAAWRRAKQLAPWLLAALVLVLIGRQLGSIDWPAVWQALQRQPRGDLARCAALALVSYALFGSYDLIGRHVVGHRVPRLSTIAIGATCYAFNLNFGSLVGAIALKLRLYDRAGLDAATVARVIGLAIVSNWLGWLAVGGTVVALAPPPLPPEVALPPRALRAIGVAMIAVVVAYLVLCARFAGRAVGWREHRFALPRLNVALWQLGVASANWALMGIIVWTLLQHALPYPTVLAVLLLAAVAGVVTHVPAGLGVIEAVFLASLAAQLDRSALLAALVSYRAVYYLLPLALAAAPYYFWGEARRRRDGTRD